MFQRWDDLLFLHWEFAPETIQRTLPPGLTVDVWEGRAFAGVVPFFMNRIRPAFLPAMPWISYFMELNVRTYVHDAQGNPGVWFYSLDCNQPLAVWLARRFFGLPYQHATMSKTNGIYRSQRRGSAETASFHFTKSPETTPAAPGSLEWFLVERYSLFSLKDGVLQTGRVHHVPYPLQSVSLGECNVAGLAPAGLELSGRPIHAIASPGVDVQVFGIERVER